MVLGSQQRADEDLSLILYHSTPIKMCQLSLDPVKALHQALLITVQCYEFTNKHVIKLLATTIFTAAVQTAWIFTAGSQFVRSQDLIYITISSHSRSFQRT